ncbi:MAG: hypothetical protein GW906_06930 [Epsilonproteobacteria bacterium]|nr:hypothetical protein [Campylobacterota bacterium]OIO13326.1 MAG: hypothetical protein AUJ81_11565 [Helicobacteraceae bacterium CG1_02_36_14]PIP10791.1 MAG: hypothetical protein COX50_04130 [Sulfurimonas sp. CG23_combo_of_CG06-09_8_20_14_all_36_33]PIS24252.1 MAG: hypothetical protein COT46_10135 [Sulfurimonas sp. CG08_land_8_20_14_0_20_36_33]PIU36057.1 MAG: hypothetical protein COT05_00975 [Sulfurimonas sp. CG07_land_8_20_14_0_80_36_56]PIV04402.1 MAG: hypothetical protein COS56_05090 [Sulfur
MNRINPLHVAALLIMLLLFFMFKLSGAKEELSQTKALYQETLSVSTELKALNESYSDKERIRKSMNLLLSHASLKSANITQKVQSSNMFLSSASLDSTALNFLLGKVLNGAYNISSLKIKRLSEKSASLEMEIKW